MIDARLTINAPHVIHESIDGEVVVINLENGNYYSLRGSGAEIWALPQGQQAVAKDAFADRIAQSYDGARDEVAAAVGDFLDELTAEGLLVSTDSFTDDAALLLAEPLGTAFERPVLEKYTDMQDLVLLDPVHEVDQQGWPQQRPSTAVSASAP